MSQRLRPSGDLSAGTWTDQAGGTTALYQRVDEPSYSDADYVKEVAGLPTPVALRLSIDAGIDPMSSTGHSIFVRCKQTGSEDMAVSLYQGVTLRATFTITPTATFSDFILTLTGVQADSITDYGDLELRFGGPLMFVSQTYFQTPDAGYDDHLDDSGPGQVEALSGSGNYMTTSGPGLLRVAGTEGATGLLTSGPGVVEHG